MIRFKVFLLHCKSFRNRRKFTTLKLSLWSTCSVHIGRYACAVNNCMFLFCVFIIYHFYCVPLTLLLMSRSREICKCIKTRLDHVMSLGRSSVITWDIIMKMMQNKPCVFASIKRVLHTQHIARMCLHLTCTLGRSV